MGVGRERAVGRERGERIWHEKGDLGGVGELGGERGVGGKRGGCREAEKQSTLSIDT